MSDSGKNRVREARAEIEGFLRNTDARRVTVDVSDLSHKECAHVMFGGAWSRLGVLFRHGLFRWLLPMPFPGLKNFFYRRCGVKIGRNVYISPFAFLDPVHPYLISIDDNALIGMDAAIVTHERTARQLSLGRVRIGESACIGGRAIIRHGVTLGEHTTVDMLVSVSDDVAPHQIVVRPKDRRLMEQGEGTE